MKRPSLPRPSASVGTLASSALLWSSPAAGLPVGHAWMAAGGQTGAEFGYAVASAGDVNGDGFDDVAIGAPSYTAGESNEGAVAVFLGSAAGVQLTPSWTAQSNWANAQFGRSVASAGDVNGDGYDDLVVGASGYANGQLAEGRAYVYLGSATGLQPAPAWTVESDLLLAAFGRSVASAGDVDGDGYDDVIIGAPSASGGQQGEGRAFLYMGSGGGLSPVPAWTAESNQVDADFGRSVAAAGDVNGDGFDDVVVGAPFFHNGESREGAASLFLGSAAGLSATPSWTAESDRVDAKLGWSVASAGDVNGDGFGDVIVGAPGYSLFPVRGGQGYLFLGSAAGLEVAPAWTADSGQASAEFGASVASAGDVDADGFDDVVVGAYAYDHGQINEGRAFLYLGTAAGLQSAPRATAESNQTTPCIGFCAYGVAFGLPVAPAGDVDGDGWADVIVGAAYYDDGLVDEGAAFVFLGR